MFTHVAHFYMLGDVARALRIAADRLEQRHAQELRIAEGDEAYLEQRRAQELRIAEGDEADR